MQDNKTLSELKLELTELQIKRTEVIDRLCMDVSPETEMQLRKSKRELELQISEQRKVISAREDANRKAFSQSLNKSKY